MDIRHTILQSLAGALGEDQAIRQCLPVSFYMVLEAAGYLPPGLLAETFCRELDRQTLGTDYRSQAGRNWSRPALSRELRRRYQASIVSWSFDPAFDPAADPADLQRMQNSGYIETQEEIDFFLDKVAGHSVEELVRQGYPVIVTVHPNFGDSGSRNAHSLVILSWTDTAVKLFDPDARNPGTSFSPSYVREGLMPNGAGSIVLPRRNV